MQWDNHKSATQAQSDHHKNYFAHVCTIFCQWVMLVKVLNQVHHKIVTAAINRSKVNRCHIHILAGDINAS